MSAVEGKVTYNDAWRNVVNDRQFQYGEIFTHQWLMEKMGLERPSNVDDIDAFNFLKMSNIEALKSYLLHEHHMLMANIRGRGYQILQPHAQTEFAMRSGFSRIRKAITRAQEQLVNVNLDMLTSDQRKENADAVAKTSMLGGMVKKVKLIEGP